MKKGDEGVKWDFEGQRWDLIVEILSTFTGAAVPPRRSNSSRMKFRSNGGGGGVNGGGNRICPVLIERYAFPAETFRFSVRTRRCAMKY